MQEVMGKPRNDMLSARSANEHPQTAYQVSSVSPSQPVWLPIVQARCSNKERTATRLPTARYSTSCADGRGIASRRVGQPNGVPVVGAQDPAPDAALHRPLCVAPGS